MYKMIKIERRNIGNERINAVDARELHEFLGLKMQFTDWIKPKIKDYGFVINSDFYRSKCIAENGRSMETYIITIDMAKELSMISKTEKGKIARKYFIDCEKKLKAIQVSLPNFDDPIAAAKAWIAEREKSIALEQETKKQAKEIEYKNDIIVGYNDEVSLAKKRKILNRVVRHKNADFKQRWRLLYREFNDANRCNIKIRVNNYEKKYNKKISKLEYIDSVMNMLPNLYEIAVKLFTADVDELVQELYDLK